MIVATRLGRRTPITKSTIELLYYVTYPDGREERLVHAFPMRLYRFEAEHLLARCAFEVQQVYANYDKSLYGSKYPGEFFVAKKVKSGGRASRTWRQATR